MSCSPAGCLFGATLSRLGWDAEAESGRIGDPRAIPSGPATPPAPRTPIACVLGGEPWQTLEGVSGVPGAADAVVGNAWNWTVLQTNVNTTGALPVETDRPLRMYKITIVPPAP